MISLFLFSVLMNSFNIIKKISEKIQTVKINRNNFIIQKLNVKPNIKTAVIIYINT